MTRFWITLQQGVDFVLDCLERMRGNEVFIPKIPSMKLTDLARAIAPECTLRSVGIRPGEKLHEIMIDENDSRITMEHDTYFVIDWNGHRGRETRIRIREERSGKNSDYDMDTATYRQGTNGYGIKTHVIVQMTNVISSNVHSPGWREGQPCPPGFRYRSDINTDWLSVEQLQGYVREFLAEHPEYRYEYEYDSLQPAMAR